MSCADRNIVFIELLTKYQRELYSYIFTLVSHVTDSDDILQETNLVLWNKRDEYEIGTNFMAWACRIAYFKVQNFRRAKGRSRVYFNETLMSKISELLVDRTESHSVYSILMMNCLEKLSSASLQLLKLRYGGDRSIQDVAKQTGRSAGSIYNTLRNIRLKLWECIQYALKEEGA